MQEPEILRQQFPAVALHEHPLRAQAQAVLLPTEPKHLDVGRRTVQDRAELDRRVGREVKVPERRLVGAVRQVLVKGAILLVADLVLGFDPDRFLGVDDLAVHLDRMGDVAGIALDDGLELPRFGVVLAVVLEMEDDLGASGGDLGGGDPEGAGAVGFPLPAAAFGLFVAAGADADAVGDHEGRVETDPELADQRERRLVPRADGGRFEKLTRATVGDRAEVCHEFVMGHPHAVVADHQLLGVVPTLQDDFQRRVVAERFIRERHIAHLVERVGGVGDQLADGDLLALIERVRQQVKKLFNLGLKGKLLRLGHRIHHQPPIFVSRALAHDQPRRRAPIRII